MSQTRARPFSKCNHFSVPGKVFILGEYAVLAGLPAVVATVGPRIELIESADCEASFAPDSPAGRLLKFASDKLGKKIPPFKFVDSTQGGFGASTAQFALTYRALAKEAGWETGWENAWTLYRELTAEGVFPPSGVDLIAQWQGGVSIISVRGISVTGKNPVSTVDATGLMDWSRFLVFSATGKAGRKVPTHTHLEELAARGFKADLPELASALSPPLLDGISAIREGCPERLGNSMNRYAGELRRAGLECEDTFKDCKAFYQIPGVLGAKGAGALQADAILVLLDRPEACDRQAVIRLGYARGLRCVADGLDHQIGITEK